MSEFQVAESPVDPAHKRVAADTPAISAARNITHPPSAQAPAPERQFT